MSECEYKSHKVKECPWEGAEQRHFGKGFRVNLCDEHFELCKQEMKLLKSISDKEISKKAGPRPKMIWTEANIKKVAKEYDVTNIRMVFRLVELGLI